MFRRPEAKVAGFFDRGGCSSTVEEREAAAAVDWVVA